MVHKNNTLLNEFVEAKSFEDAEKSVKKAYPNMELVSLVTKVPSESEANKAQAKAEADMLETAKVKAEAKQGAERKAKARKKK